MKSTLIALLALAVGTASAQVRVQVQADVIQLKRIAPGMPFPGNTGNTIWTMLQQAGVKEDIGLTREQQQKLNDIEAKKNKDLLALVEKGGRAYLLGFEKITEQFDKDLETALTKEQFNRLDQIRFQQATRYGLQQALMYNAEYRDKFKIDVEQRKKIQELQTEMNLAMRGLPRNIPIQERQAAQQQIRESTDDRIAKEVLNKEQQALLEKLRGKPFKGLNLPGGIRRR